MGKGGHGMYFKERVVDAMNVTCTLWIINLVHNLDKVFRFTSSRLAPTRGIRSGECP